MITGSLPFLKGVEKWQFYLMCYFSVIHFCITSDTIENVLMKPKSCKFRSYAFYTNSGKEVLFIERKIRRSIQCALLRKRERQKSRSGAR